MEINKKIDVSGVVCPIPAAETRKALRNSDSGFTFEIIGDCMHAVENIENMAKKQNGRVIKSETLNNSFRIIIQKN